MSAPRPPSTAPDGRPIRVVHLIHTVAHGGVETILINWLTHLDRSQVDARLVVFANPGSTEQAFVDAAAKAGLPVKSIPWAKRKPVILATKKLVQILREDQIEIIHAHNLYAEIVGYLAARIVGCKILTTQYVWADFGWKRNIMQVIAARVIRRFDLVTSQCEETMRETTRRGVPPGIQKVLISGIEPCHEWLTPRQRADERAALGIAPDELVLANVARLYPEKAQALLLKMFRTILDQRPKARLWILGVGPLEAELKALAAELKLGDAVRFPGFVRNPTRFLQLLDIQVHPSFAEGVPLALCEGMAAGMPILATAVGGVPEIIQTEKSGLLVPARDEHAFIEQCIRLIDDPALRARLSKGARTFIETQYTLDVAASHLVRTYEDLVR